MIVTQMIVKMNALSRRFAAGRSYSVVGVEQQKAHHAAGAIIPGLQRVDDRPLLRARL